MERWKKETQTNQDLLKCVEDKLKACNFRGHQLLGHLTPFFLPLIESQAHKLWYRNLNIWLSLNEVCGNDAESQKNANLPYVGRWPPKGVKTLLSYQTMTNALGLFYVTETSACLVDAWLEQNGKYTDYFVNVGCANLFNRYMDKQSMDKAKKFLSRYVSIGSVRLWPLLANFLMHSLPFMKRIRSDFAIRKWQGDEYALSNSIAESVKYLSEEHVYVMQKAIEKDCARWKEMLINDFIKPMLVFWNHSYDMVICDVNVDNEVSMAHEAKFFDPIIAEIKKGSFTPILESSVVQRIEGLFSILDMLLLNEFVQGMPKGNKFLPDDCDIKLDPGNQIAQATSMCHFDVMNYECPCVGVTNIEDPTGQLLNEWHKIVIDADREGREPIYQLPGIADIRKGEQDIDPLTIFGLKRRLAELDHAQDCLDAIRDRMGAYGILEEGSEEVDMELKMIMYFKAKKHPIELQQKFGLMPVNDLFETEMMKLMKTRIKALYSNSSDRMIDRYLNRQISRLVNAGNRSDCYATLIFDCIRDTKLSDSYQKTQDCTIDHIMNMWDHYYYGQVMRALEFRDVATGVKRMYTRIGDQCEFDLSDCEYIDWILRESLRKFIESPKPHEKVMSLCLFAQYVKLAIEHLQTLQFSDDPYYIITHILDNLDHDDPEPAIGKFTINTLGSAQYVTTEVLRSKLQLLRPEEIMSSFGFDVLREYGMELSKE